MSKCPKRKTTPSLRILHGDCRETLKTLPDASVQACVTSPPYWGLRSYLPKGHPDKALEIGQEKTPAEYVRTMVELFREVRRALKDDGVLWLNLGDSYAGSGKTRGDGGAGPASSKQRTNPGAYFEPSSSIEKTPDGLKPKDLIGVPWRVALALQADVWYLRSDIIWAKPNCMPESVTDRPTRSHEYIFLLSKSERYYYDHEAIKEPAIYGVASMNGGEYAPPGQVPHSTTRYKNPADFNGKNKGREKQRGRSRRHNGFNDRWDKMSHAEQCTGMRNKRDVWTIPPAQYSDAHFAVFPPDLIKPCILAGSAHGDMILDPFGGSGTTGRVAIEFGRKAILCELNADYLPMIEARTSITLGLPL